jgi:hypothetical protein
MSNPPEILIFGKRYWDRPEPKAKGASEPKVIYQAVGEALSQWETVDQDLSDLFLVFVSEPDSSKFTVHALRRAYGSIISTAGRRTTIRMAADVYFPPWRTNNKDELDGLKNILKVGSWAAELRDDLAHGVGVENIERRIRENGPETLQTGQFGSFLMPPEYNSGRTLTHSQDGDHPADIWKARYCYNDDDINNIKWKFYHFGVEIRKYAEFVTPYVKTMRTIARDTEGLFAKIKAASTSRDADSD